MNPIPQDFPRIWSKERKYPRKTHHLASTQGTHGGKFHKKHDLFLDCPQIDQKNLEYQHNKKWLLIWNSKQSTASLLGPLALDRFDRHEASFSGFIFLNVLLGKPLLHLPRKGLEQMLYIWVGLGRSLEICHPLTSCIDLSLLPAHHPLTDHITFVPHQDLHRLVVAEPFRLSHPVFHILEAAGVA